MKKPHMMKKGSSSPSAKKDQVGKKLVPNKPVGPKGQKGKGY